MGHPLRKDFEESERLPRHPDHPAEPARALQDRLCPAKERGEGMSEVVFTERDGRGDDPQHGSASPVHARRAALHRPVPTARSSARRCPTSATCTAASRRSASAAPTRATCRTPTASTTSRRCSPTKRWAMACEKLMGIDGAAARAVPARHLVRAQPHRQPHDRARRDGHGHRRGRRRSRGRSASASTSTTSSRSSAARASPTTTTASAASPSTCPRAGTTRC